MDMTPKQTLIAHIREFHTGHAAAVGGGAAGLERRSYRVLQSLHSRWHWRYRCNHYHEGMNLGPGERPEGWRTGKDAVQVEIGRHA
jgi:hypothetical protein